MSKKIDTSIAFWENIIIKRNFDEKGYDLEATNYIKDKLGLPKDKTILMGLKSKDIDIENFIKVFFESMEDFSNMMSDLLNMFEEIAVKKTDKNLDIEFDFDKGKSPATVNLSAFKEQVSFFENIQKEYEIPTLESGKLWDIARFLYIENDCDRLINNTNKIIENFDYNFEKWFEGCPELKQTGNLRLDIQLEKVFYIWVQVLNEIRSYGVKPGKARLLDEISSILQLDNNEWIPIIIDRINKLATCDEIVQNEITTKLEDFFIDMPVRKIEIIDKVEKFEEFLKLPFWDKRYELYSVWVFALIYRATKDYGLKVHTVDNKLVFPFKETHLATITCASGNILIFSEKRTRMSNPVGKTRTKNIQPDYSFYKEPISDSNASIMEIECKQYKKQSTDNFARALIDYANGRKNAEVLLVNYGVTNKESIFNKIDTLCIDNKIQNNKDRCSVIGDLTPNNKNCLIDIIQDKISKYACLDHKFSFNTPFRVELYWKKPSEDLDLYMTVKEEDNTECICYRNSTTRDIKLIKDVREGSKDPETILINEILKGEYSFFVHNCTSDSFDENIVCKIIIDDKAYKELKPSSKQGNYWKVFDINMRESTFNIVNEVSKITNEDLLKICENHRNRID